MLHKIQQRYPNAAVYCMGMLTRSSVSATLTAANLELKAVVEHFHVPYIELESLTNTTEGYNACMGNTLHPKGEGMDRISQRAISALLGKEIALHDVSCNLMDVNSSNLGRLTVAGNQYETTLTPKGGFGNLQVTVSMGGMDITDTCYADGSIRIANVSGAVEITAKATQMTVGYRWEKQADGTMKSVSTENGYLANPLTPTNYGYQMEHSVKLDPTKNWTISFKRTAKTGVFLLTTDPAVSAGTEYLWCRTNGAPKAIGFGRLESGYQNYVASDPCADASEYLIENKYDAETGKNVVYLTIDGGEAMPMNQHYNGESEADEDGDGASPDTVEWLNGKTMEFQYMGASGSFKWTTSTPVTYMEIWPNGKPRACDHTLGDWHFSDEHNKIVRTCECGETLEIANFYVDYPGTDTVLYAGFENAADAFTFASSHGSSVMLNQDVAVAGNLRITGTLNLNGHVLTVTGGLTVLNGGNLVDEYGEGILKVDKNKLVMDCGSFAAVWSESAGGYVMMDTGTEKTKTKQVAVNANAVAFYYQPALHASAIEELKAGHQTSGIKICITVSWKVDGVEDSEKFYVGDALLNQYLAAYDENGTPKLAFRLTLTGVEKVDVGSLNFTTSIEHMNYTVAVE
jgi:hypothetical protein